MASRVEHSHRTTDDNSSKLLDQLQNDLKNLCLESRKRHPQIKEACEECIVKLRTALLNPQIPLYNMTNQILYPIVQGCESKDRKIVALCIGVIQKLIIQQAVDQKGSRFITDALWTLTDNGTEEVKVLQTVTLLLTTNSVVRGDTLAKNLVLCFRLNFGKQSTIVNAAGATVRQLVSLIFERAVTEDEQNPGDIKNEINIDELKVPSSHPPSSLRPSAADAYLMFQDLVQLVNADQPYWLSGLSEMTRTFGLELMESVLVKFSSLFFLHPEFKFLLKERVCALVIKLFSPNLKYRNHGQSVHQAATFDKPYFPISIRLLRVVNTLIQQYHSILVTECEIFLSLIVKFVESDKPTWQRTVALEVLHKLSVQPDLLMAFCECYDLRVHSTNVFQDIVNCFGGYVQSQFDNPPLSSSGTNGPHGQGNTSGSGPSVSAQPGFHLRGIWLPITFTIPPGQTKASLLETMDKIEPPVISDGYGVTIAYASLQDIVRSIATVMDKLKVSEKEVQPRKEEESDNVDTNSEVTNKLKLQRQLINSSWFGILMALTPLIDASTDENVTENMLKTMEIYASLAGRVNESSARDAFITAICRAALPTSYNLPILNASAPTFGYSSHEALSLQYSIYGSGEIDYKQQVVAVGTAMPSPTSASSSSAVMLTAKNLQCMRALLILSHSYGSMLGSAWLLVLTTLQHLVWILGLKPTTGGSLKAGRSNIDSNAVITTAVMADLPVLSSMLSRLFESSRNLEPASLNQLIDALCLLSNEAMEVAYNNREPSLFAVAKLLETGLVNLERVETVWRPLTNHLLDVCQHPHIRMREWGVEAITYLVKSALQYKFQAPLKENQKLQTLLLSPLVELSTIPYCDVRQRQVECILNILHSTGEVLTHGWPLILSIVGAIDENHGENLIRIAFQCLQLIVTDFLPLMPWRCMPLCLETTSRFGSQSQELNISLTAIGLMWNVADYFFHNREKLCEALSADGSIFPDCPFSSELPPFDKLWMCLFTRLSELCVDVRPAVRKSAGQTLFSTISAHGSLLSTNTWQAVLWQVLFPLLDKVRSKSSSASTKKVDAGGSILIHHSRNTAQKQWAETQVLTLSGVARVFNTKRQLLLTLGNYPKAWSLLLEFVENSALSYNDEVSLAALRAFQEILYVSENAEKNDETDIDSSNYSEVNKEIWEVTWDVWLRIALESLRRNNSSTINIDIDYCPSQPFLASLLHIFPSVFQHIRSRFSSCDMEKLCHVLESAAAVPIFGEGSHFASADGSLSQLQEAVLNCIEKLQINALGSEESMQISICAVFKQLISFCKYAYEIPHFMRKHLEQKEATVVNYVPFGERSITMLVNLYRESASQKPVIKGEVLKLILEALDIPLTKRYDRTTFGTWKLTVASFMTVLSDGIPLARKCPEDFQSMWPVLALCLDHLLFPKTLIQFDRKDRPTEQLIEDEAIDCQVVDFIKEEILSHSKCIPKDFMLKIVVLLNKGSILTTNGAPIRRGYEPNLREEFAKECFETLLEFSLLDGLDENKPEQERLVTKDTDGELAGRLAVTALIFRFQEVLEKHVQDESRSGKCPLPRHRLSEISFVLKAIATLIQSLKTNPQKVNRSVWDQLILLYPYLVNCTVTSYTQISDSVRDALHQYSDLLTPPNLNSTTTVAVTATSVYGNLKATLEDAISSSSAT